MPDLTDLASAPPRKVRDPGRTRLMTAGIVGGLVLLGAGYAIGHFTTSSGPATLVEAVQQASTGKLPCGTPSTTTTAGGTGHAGGLASGAFITRLCRGATAGGAGGRRPRRDVLAKSTVVVNTTQDASGARTATRIFILPAPTTSS